MSKRIRVNGIIYEAVDNSMSEAVKIPSIEKYTSKPGKKSATLERRSGKYGLFLTSYVKKDDFLTRFNCTSPYYYSIKIGFGESADFLSGGLVAEIRHFYSTASGEMWSVTVKADVSQWSKSYRDFDSAVDVFNAVTKKFSKIDLKEDPDFHDLCEFGRDEIVPILKKLGFRCID